MSVVEVYKGNAAGWWIEYHPPINLTDKTLKLKWGGLKRAYVTGEFIRQEKIKFRVYSLNKGQSSEINPKSNLDVQIENNIIKGLIHPTSNELIKIWDSEESYPHDAVTVSIQGDGEEKSGTQGGRRKRRRKKRTKKKSRKKKRKTLKKKRKRRKKKRKTRR